MDAFWLIPFGIVVIAFVVTLYAYLKTRQTPPPNPHVLLDKPPEELPPGHPSQSDHWSHRPCGSVLDWLSGRS
ncbi:MAG TPA: hypothetical protein VGO67_19780 [Verrucomicrobiae bacterium]|jgi:hypothetical protein